MDHNDYEINKEIMILSTISIVIPCYNHAHYLGECLHSLVSQSIETWEAVIVDDCSPDGSQIQAFVETFRDSRIRVIRHDRNKGLAASRNSGARISRGKYLVFLDADDFIFPDFCKQTCEYLDGNSQVDAVFTAFQEFGAKNSMLFTHKYSEDPTLNFLRQWAPGAGCVMRRQVWEQIGGYCELEIFRNGMEDREFWIASIQYGIVVENIPVALYAYRRYDGSMSQRMLPMMHKLHHAIIKRHWKTIPKQHQRRYLARGYRTSAKAFSEMHQDVRAVHMVLCGLFNDWGNKPLWRLLRHSLGAIITRHRKNSIVG